MHRGLRIGAAPGVELHPDLPDLRGEVRRRQVVVLPFVSGGGIKNKLLELIGNEDKSNPLSDEDLVAKLQESGYPVARRTVTKYRKMLNIPSSRERKDWALVP